MALRSNALPTDPALLTEAALALQAENESLRATIVTLKALIFGARSERLSTMGAEQFALDLAEGHDDAPHSPTNDDAAAGPRTLKKPRKKAERQSLCPREPRAFGGGPL